MKSTGIVRRLDELGRIVLPIEMRRSFDLGEKDQVEILVENGCIVLKKYQPDCIFCSGSSELVDFKGKNVCRKCIRQLEQMQT